MKKNTKQVSRLVDKKLYITYYRQVMRHNTIVEKHI
jgi:hypothetical protein